MIVSRIAQALGGTGGPPVVSGGPPETFLAASPRRGTRIAANGHRFATASSAQQCARRAAERNGRAARSTRRTAFAIFAAIAAHSAAADLFPFVLPWDDATPSIIDLSAWNEAPAGKHGFVVVKDGHLFAGGKRLRIFGVNVAFGANFPRKEDAEKIAARMAKFGINCVRFHHMDMMNAPGGIFARDGTTLDPGQLDRLDYFIAQLAARGIYSDLNLHVSRTYPDRPKSEKEGSTNYDKGVDNFSAPLIAAQKDYARALLTHVNPYTKHAYVEEPAVALVEINNENALLDEWHNGGLDKAASPYRAELGALWTKWLAQKYGGDEKLRAAWAAGARAEGAELLRNGDFANGLDPWTVEKHEGAIARGEVRDGALHLEIEKPGKAGWHVQATQPALKLRAGESYAFRFRARAGAKRPVTAVASQAHEPWKVFASKSVDLTPEWRDFTFIFKADADDDNARVGFTSLGLETGWVEFSKITLRIAGIDGDLRRDADGSVRAFTRDDSASRTPAAREDWLRFLWNLEEQYWPAMVDFLRKDLQCRSLIVGTQLGWSPFPIQARMDVIDSHNYWQHPHFPHRQWDMNDWTVQNVSMAGAPDGGTLPGLALQRIAGKPYICTEYNHSAPNQFASETFPLICACAALQDWDGIFAFAYSHRADDWDKRAIAGFFDIDQHPTKMATLAASLALFRRADIAPAKTERIARLSLEQAIQRVAGNGPRFGAQHFGVPPLMTFVHRVGVALGEAEALPAGVVAAQRVMSDTGELVWDTENRVAVVNTPASKAVVGALHGRTFRLGDLSISPGASQEWACIQLTVIDGADFAHARRILITATGAAENTGMKWRDAAKTSVGTDWGKAPSVVEGIAATIQFPNAGKLKAWALDERGYRRGEVPFAEGKLEITPEHKTLWYEVAAE